MILHGDCMEKLKELEPNSVDAVITDPPYGLKFMNKQWDYDVPSIETWLEVLRVLKPGGHLLSFGGTRTYHRMVVAIEDAGFEIRDQIQWIYGSGFPKSLDISKAIDKAAGVEREVVGKKSTYRAPQSPNGWDCIKRAEFETAPNTDKAKQWQGWGTALKPANEPIVLARKSLEKGLTVAENVLKWGVGGLNIDGTRIEASDQAAPEKNWDRVQSKSAEEGRNAMSGGLKAIDLSNRKPIGGRWPANLILDEAAAEMLGEPSRFFYCAKASKSERNAGLEGMPLKISGGMSGTLDGTLKTGSGNERNNLNQNFHPTVKPIRLMEYLIKLITPSGGTVLDPFMGSGSTGVAAKRLGFKFIGIEMNKEYVEIAEKRIESVS